jgi:DNA mismatch repair protein MutL
MPIRLLPETMTNQIAAGEVIERPASVVKELVENAIDAGADRIEIVTSAGGLGLIRVSDNGAGIAADELELAVSRHCTSKLDDNIHDIRTLGFRGEALPSIGSVARLSVKSRQAASDNGSEIRVEAGRLSKPKPVAINRGTIVEVTDLFFVTPARLKFMKSARAESHAITQMIKRIALSAPHVRFDLAGSDRSAQSFAASDVPGRIADIVSTEFIENAVEIEAVREGIQLTGYAGLPAYHRANSLSQFVNVNGRPVRDKMIAGALRGAYADLMARDRHPVVALNIVLDPSEVDVNVHPAKADVRFRDAALVRGLIIGAIRSALLSSGVRADTSASSAMMAAFSPEQSGTGGGYRSGTEHQQTWQAASSPYRPLDGLAEAPQARFEPATPGAVPGPEHPLGAARAQIHENYIIAQTGDGMVIVDQHAAHERLVYEALKRGIDERGVAGQLLLIPVIVDLPEEDCDRLAEAAESLSKLGLLLERFGPGAVAVRETPALLGDFDVAGVIVEIADALADDRGTATVRERLYAVASRIACHGSVRSGRRMSAPEMDALLRQMERTPGSGTCNHGRPTFITLKLSDIEKLFGRR